MHVEERKMVPFACRVLLVALSQTINGEHVMGYKSGEIYFVREQDGQGYSPHVKIGLVHEPRDSFDRLSEHQTGNPRVLQIDRGQIVKTDAVDRVEAQLHKIFAPNRVSGEWFELPSEAAVETAVTKARELAVEIGSLMPIFTQAEDLSLQASSEEQIPPSEEALTLSAEIARAKGELEVCSELEQAISQKLQEAIRDEKGVVKGAAQVVTVNHKSKFMLEDFKNENPDLFAKYLDTVQSWSQLFRTKAKKLGRDSLENDFLEEVGRIEALIGGVISVEEAFLLNEPQLLITNLKALSSWTHDVSVAKLKVLCGTNAGIENVCTWTRKQGDPKFVFNEKLFVQDNPETYLDYLAEATTGTYLRVAKRKV